jgi:hypothetical protein
MKSVQHKEGKEKGTKEDSPIVVREAAALARALSGVLTRHSRPCCS